LDSYIARDVRKWHKREAFTAAAISSDFWGSSVVTMRRLACSRPSADANSALARRLAHASVLNSKLSPFQFQYEKAGDFSTITFAFTNFSSSLKSVWINHL
jgi:hypothetical protein